MNYVDQAFVGYLRNTHPIKIPPSELQVPYQRYPTEANLYNTTVYRNTQYHVPSYLYPYYGIWVPPKPNFFRVN